MSKIIALCGAASCGKTTTAYTLRNSLIKDHVTEIVHEYAREYLLRNEHGNTLVAQMIIFNEQLEREKTIINNPKVKIVICECPLFLNYLYVLSMQLVSNKSTAWPQFLSEIYKKCVEQLFCYDYIYYLPSMNTEFKDDAVRGEAKQHRHKVESAIKGFLDIHAVDYITIDCPKEERANMILEYLGDKI